MCFSQKIKKLCAFWGKVLAHLTMLHRVGALKGGRMLTFKDCDAFSVKWLHSCLCLMSPKYF